ncbi:hypothetical protein WSM22_37850 [Cytophagales bacterium WSM2-2]|nr:hypothetical protein WSM22_37850 [Cytophagales bacterium WSM2-2]
MPKIYTNPTGQPVPQSPPLPAGSPPANSCVISYQQYKNQRVSKAVNLSDIQSMTDSFKKRISDPIGVLNPDIEMGQYFVIPIDEIRAMLNSCKEEVQFVHVCNALRYTKNSDGETKIFPVTIVVPVVQGKDESGRDIFEVCQEEDTIYTEAYPCPPDPHCPTNDMVGVILKSTTKLNDFKSLL